jgi:hypothetical protein
MEFDGLSRDEEEFLSYVEPLHVSIRAAENGFIVTTSGGKTQAKTYIANTLEHAQSIVLSHFN